MKTSLEQRLRMRNYRKSNNNSVTKKYERTRKGKLMRCYRNMLSRINGVQAQKHHLYQGKEILSKEDFYKWALADDSFNSLYDHWCESDYDRKLAPSVDRINSSKGYVLGNMEWVTHSENSRRGGLVKACDYTLKRQAD